MIQDLTPLFADVSIQFRCLGSVTYRYLLGRRHFSLCFIEMDERESVASVGRSGSRSSHHVAKRRDKYFPDHMERDGICVLMN